jgi:hypothetical protein
MKLNQLFEQSLAPGERRIVQVSIRDLKKIEQRIRNLESSLYQSDDLALAFKQDVALQSALTNLKDRIRRKIAALEKVKARPTAQQTEFVLRLKSECSEAIEAMQAAQKFLFRGIRSHDNQFEGRSREDREPKDSSSVVSDLFDQMMRKLGVQALRSNSIFTTSSYGFASAYGSSVYILLPKNGFHFLSTNQRDLVLESKSQLADKEEIADLLQELDAWGHVHVSDWQNTDLSYSIKSGNWTYALIKVNDEFAYNNNRYNLPTRFNVDIQDFISPESVQKNFDPNTKNLEFAIASGNEVLIYGEYWALRSDVWGQILSQEWNIRYQTW